MRYNGTRHTTEVGTTKRSKVRTVDFCDTLAAILRAARTEQRKNRFRYGEFYHLNYYKEVKEKGRTYYEVYSLQRTEAVSYTHLMYMTEKSKIYGIILKELFFKTIASKNVLNR